MPWHTPYTADPRLADYTVLEHPSARVMIHREYLQHAAALGLGDREPPRVGEVSGGREAHAVLELPGGERVVSRRYRRGGMLRHLNGSRYLAGHRAMEELLATAHAAAGGVRAPRVIAAVERPARIGYTGTLNTRLVPEARELATWLTSAATPGRVAAWRSAGEQVARMHDAGVAHPDLNLKNFLVGARGDGPPEVWIIDFDRAVVHMEGVPAGRRARDLRRLRRSVNKLGARWGPAEAGALRAGYGDSWPLRSLLE